MTKQIWWCAVGLTAMACGPLVYTTQLSSEYAPRPDDADVMVYSEKAPACAFDEVGLITSRITALSTDHKVLEGLKREAREMGADAVIAVREVPPVPHKGGRGLAATAIRFRDADCRS